MEDRPRWQHYVQRVLAAGLVFAALYLAFIFIGRLQESSHVPPKPKPLPLSPDYYVLPPKSYVRSLADARAFAGQPLWVRTGYRWTCAPQPDLLGPLEELAPTRAFERRGQVWLEFNRNGQPCAVAISSGERFILDDIFFIKDPHTIYKDWSAETWKKIETRQIEPGMTETQITFALGFGLLARGLSSRGDAYRVVDHTSGEPKLRITYEYGVATHVEPAPR
jgi:hypothetical protein